METLSEKEITKRSYQMTAQAFANSVADLAPIASIERFIKFLPPQPKIIDVGCGSGRDAKIFTSLGADVLGIDYCSDLLDIAKTHASLANFQLMDMEAMNLPVASFDGAWAACSLGHLTKKMFPMVLQKIYSLLKPGGYFYLALKKGSGEALEEDERYAGSIKKFWAFYEEDELKNILVAIPFKILDFAVVEKDHAYLTHSAFRVFCQKN